MVSPPRFMQRESTPRRASQTPGFPFFKILINSRPVKVQTSIWDVLTRLVVALLFVALVVVVYYWYRPQIEKNRRFRHDILALDKQIEAEEKLYRQNTAAIDSLQNDPRTVERLVREKLGYARSNETVIRFESPVRR